VSEMWYQLAFPIRSIRSRANHLSNLNWPQPLRWRSCHDRLKMSAPCGIATGRNDLRVCIPGGDVLASVLYQTRRTKMIRYIVLAFAVFAGLSGAALVSAGLTAQPAAACEQRTS